MHEVIESWKRSLGRLLRLYEARRGPLLLFMPLLFLFFVVVNIVFYWLAMVTAFPQLLNSYYFKVQFPVGFFGALFDSLSFFVTLYIIRRALRSENNWAYLGHLSIDLLIALLATIWVVYVFAMSGWLIKWIETMPQLWSTRTDRYEQMVFDALVDPRANLRNIYFGLVMGLSAMIPTTLHVMMFIRAVWRRRRTAGT